MWQGWKKQSGVKIVGIGLLDTREAAQAFVRRHHLTFPNGYDGGRKIARLYGFTYQPYWAVIDKAGRLLRTGYGPASEQELASTIRQLTGE